MAENHISDEQLRELLEQLQPRTQNLVLQRAAMRELGPFLSLVKRIEHPSTRFLVLKMCRINLCFACANQFPNDERLRKATGAACDMKPIVPFDDAGVGSDWWNQEAIRRAIGGSIGDDNNSSVGSVTFAFDELQSHGSISNERQLGYADIQKGTRLTNDVPLYPDEPGVWSPSPARGERDEAPEGALEFQFWVDWYWSFINGRPNNWETWRHIASINEDLWQAGPEPVSERIKKIQEEFAGSSDRTEATRHQAVQLLSTPKSSAFIAFEVAKRIQYAVSSNALPLEFHVLREAPEVLFAISSELKAQHNANAQLSESLAVRDRRIVALEKEIGQLLLQVERLARDLEHAKRKNRLNKSIDTVTNTSLVILTTAFWAHVLPALGHVIGSVDFGGLFDRLLKSVSEPPIGPLEGGDTWDQPPADV